MINLLPSDLQQMYRYGRRNRMLLHWVIGAGLGLVCALLLMVAGVVILQVSANSYNQQVADTNKQLQKQNVGDIQKQVTEISNNLKLTAQVLSKEILFSQLLKQLGTVIPPNTSLTNLAISQTRGAIDITAQTANYNAATQLQVNLADPTNRIFSKADIVSITCASGSNQSKYPCTIILRALFATDNPFLFTETPVKAAP